MAKIVTSILKEIGKLGRLERRRREQFWVRKCAEDQQRC
jgi:hypothetical protein